MLKGGRIVYPSEYYKASGGGCVRSKRRCLSKRKNKNKKNLSKKKLNSKRKSLRRRSSKRKNRK